MEILLSAAATLGASDPADASPLLAAFLPIEPATAGLPAIGFDWHALVDYDLWDQVPADVDDLLRLLPQADLYVQDELNLDFHPTLTRTWSRKGRRGQRRVRTPGVNRKLIGFGAIDWRTGWLSHGIGLRRDSATLCLQLDHLVERSQARGRVAILLWDNLGIHTRRGSRRLRAYLDVHGDCLCLVYTPAYDPDANPTERLWRPLRLAVTHNHHRDTLAELYHDGRRYFRSLDAAPQTVLAHIGSPFAPTRQPNEC